MSSNDNFLDGGTADLLAQTFMDNAWLFPWALCGLLVISTCSAAAFIDLWKVWWRDRHLLGWTTALQMDRLSLGGICMTLFLGTTPDAIFLLTLGEVSDELSIFIRKIDLVFDCLVVFPFLTFYVIALTNRKRIMAKLVPPEYFATIPFAPLRSRLLGLAALVSAGIMVALSKMI